MRTITPEEMAEPDVFYYVPEGARPPEEVAKYLEGCIGTPLLHKATRQVVTRYRIPGYLAREWIALADELEAKQEQPAEAELQEAR